MRKKRSLIWKISKESLEKTVKNNTSIAGILRDLGFAPYGAIRKTLQSRLTEDNIDYSHIPLGQDSNKNRTFEDYRKPLSEILVEDSNYSRFALKKRLFGEGIFEEKCDDCGIGPEWNGKDLALQLDHINGKSKDNRLENLRILCPNCHSQTDTFAGKNIPKVIHKCSKCNGPVNRTTKNKICFKCFAESRRKVERPTEEELLEMINTMPMTKIGEKFGVSDNAVRKWVKQYESIGM